MSRHRHDTGRARLKKRAAHRKLPKRRSVLTRTVAAGGAALAIGATYEMCAPTAQALSILLPGPSVDGVSNTTRIDIFEGNIFNPQFGIGGSASDNNVIGNIAVNIGNQIINSFLDFELNFGAAAAGNGNVTQVNLFSYNIFNPQISLGPNVSNNTTISNVAMNNGNNSTSNIAGGGLPLVGGAMGNGNTVQFSMFSGNIFNPQWSIGGNASNNVAITNVAAGNGNNSQSTIGFGGLFGSFLFGGGNGNTTQFGFFVSNIYNPQWSLGGGNASNNSATTNASSGNGNGSTNVITGSGGLGTVTTGTTGNGQTNQFANSSGNIINDQVNIGVNLNLPAPSPSPTNTAPVNPQQLVAAATVGSDDTDLDITALREADEQNTDVDPGTGSPDDNSPALQEENPPPSVVDNPTPPDNTAGSPPSDPGSGGQPDVGGGTDGSGEGGGNGGV